MWCFNNKKHLKVIHVAWRKCKGTRRSKANSSDYLYGTTPPNGENVYAVPGKSILKLIMTYYIILIIVYPYRYTT